MSSDQSLDKQQEDDPTRQKSPSPTQSNQNEEITANDPSSNNAEGLRRRQSSIVSVFWNLVQSAGRKPSASVAPSSSNEIAKAGGDVLSSSSTRSLKSTDTITEEPLLRGSATNNSFSPQNHADTADEGSSVKLVADQEQLAASQSETTTDVQAYSWWSRKMSFSTNENLPLSSVETQQKVESDKKIAIQQLQDHLNDQNLTAAQPASSLALIEITNKLIPHDDSFSENEQGPVQPSVEPKLYEAGPNDVEVELNTELEDQVETESIEMQHNIVVPQFDTLPESSIFQNIYNALHSTASTLTSSSTSSSSSSSTFSSASTSSSSSLPLSSSPTSATSTATSASPGEKPRDTNKKFKKEKVLLLSRKKLPGTPKKIVLIGVHGFFPHKRVRAILGNPTGTSNKFIKEAEHSIREYYKKKTNNAKLDIEISKIALEREGMIFDRVDFFFEVLRKYQKELNETDMIYFVAHSQGCPVTIMLLSRLIEEGVILPPTKTRKIGILAMAGINNGPSHGGMDSNWLAKLYFKFEGETMQELFQFQDFDSLQSKRYLASLKSIISCNVKICFVGSITDQLVPLYSSTCGFAFHPNIFKSTYIDKDSNTPAFLIKVVEAANRLINMGLSDHKIIKEISRNLMGPLTGGGHSKIYSDEGVYLLGYRFVWETTDLFSNEVEFSIDYPTGKTIETLHCKKPLLFKPYVVRELGSYSTRLPWCMRGFLCEVQIQFGKRAVREIIHEFEVWDPKDEELIKMKNSLSGMLHSIL